MYRTLPVLLLLALPLAGCLDAPTDDLTPASDPAAEIAPPVALPEPIEDTQMVVGSLDPLNYVGEPICSAPSAQCFRYPFTLAGDAKVAADLAWGIPANDFDLYLHKAGGTEVAVSGAAAPGTSEAIAETSGAGDYEVIVVAWGVAQDTFTVKIDFTAVAPAAPAEDAAEGNETAPLR